MKGQGCTILVVGTSLLVSAFRHSLFGWWNISAVESLEAALQQPVPDATVLLCPTLAYLHRETLQRLHQRGHKCVLVLFFTPSLQEQQALRSLSLAGVISAALSGTRLALVLSQICEGMPVFLPPQFKEEQLPPTSYRIMFSPSTLYRFVMALGWESLQPADIAVLAQYFDADPSLPRSRAALRRDFSVRIYDFLTDLRRVTRGEASAVQERSKEERVNSRLAAALVLLESGILRQVPVSSPEHVSQEGEEGVLSPRDG